MKIALTENMLEELLSKGDDFDIKVCYDMNELREYMKISDWSSDYAGYEANSFTVDWWETWTKDGKTLNLAGAFWYSFLRGTFS